MHNDYTYQLTKDCKMAGGRPTKFTQEVQDIIIRALNLGSTYELACQSAGIGYSTFREWIVEAEKDPCCKYAQFAERVKKTEGAAVERWLAIIDAAAEKSWQAAAWKLERRYWKSFSAKVGEIDMNERLTVVEGKTDAKT
jgi:transposase